MFLCRVQQSLRVALSMSTRLSTQQPCSRPQRIRIHLRLKRALFGQSLEGEASNNGGVRCPRVTRPGTSTPRLKTCPADMYGQAKILFYLYTMHRCWYGCGVELSQTHTGKEQRRHTSESHTCAVQVAGLCVWSRSISSPMTNSSPHLVSGHGSAHALSTREGYRLPSTAAGLADGVVDQAAVPWALRHPFICAPLALDIWWIDRLMPPR